MPDAPRSVPEFLVFGYDAPRAGRDVRTAVVFWTVRGVNGDRLHERLRDRFDALLPPGRIVLVAPADCEGDIAGMLADDRVLDQVRAATRYTDAPAVHGYVFDASGALTPVAAAAGAAPPDPDRPAMVLHGLRHLFAANAGTLDGHGRVHFVKPSGAHSSRFLRTANVLRSGVEIDFVAFGLLPHVPVGTRRVYTDTGSINSVAYSLLSLRARLDPATAHSTTVETFSSYRGARTFHLDDRAHAVCLVSASTAGALSRELSAEREIPLDRVVTLFYAGADPAGAGPVVCDLVTPAGPDSIAPVDNHWRAACPDCTANVRALTFSGDQFLPADTTTTPVLLRATDVPAWVPRVARATVGLGAVSCVPPELSGGTAPEIRVDARVVLDPANGRALSLACERALDRAVPATTSLVVHLDDAASEDLARRVVSRLPPDRDAPVVPARELLEAPGSVRADGRTVVVVAADAGTGRTLLSLSQALRQAPGPAVVCWLVGLARPAAPGDFRVVSSDLGYGSDGPGSNPVVVVEQLCLPDAPSPASAFLHELHLLRAMSGAVHPFGVLDGVPLAPPEGFLEALQERVGVLSSGDDGDGAGLRQRLLLPSSCPDDRTLRLRPGFAFWPGVPYDAADVTQADVYLTVAGVLHSLRQEGRGAQSLFEQDHDRGVLSPANLSRYNDGVIQGCLLRAARPAETDYHAEPAVSGHMSDVARLLLDAHGTAAGEAAGEVLLALATGQLRLVPSDRQRLLAPHLDRIRTGTSPFSPLEQALAVAAASR